MPQKGKRVKLKEARRLPSEAPTKRKPLVVNSHRDITLTPRDILTMSIHNCLSDTENFPLCMNLNFDHVASFVKYIFANRQVT